MRSWLSAVFLGIFLASGVFFLIGSVAFADEHVKKTPVTPQTTPGGPEAEPEQKIEAESHLQGTQSKWYKLEGNYTADFFQNFDGGVKRGAAFLSLLSLRGNFDLDNALGLKTTTFFLHLQGEQGRHPSEWVGDAQVSDNIEAPVDTGRVYEAWLQKSFSEGKFTALLGFYDINSEFYVNAPAALFINSSLGVGRELSQTGKMGPSIYPVTSTTLRLKYQPSTEYYAQVAVLDGVPGDPKHVYGTHTILKPEDGYLMIAEAGWIPSEKVGQEEVPFGKLAIGTWSYTEKFDHLTEVNGSGEPTQKTNMGYYMIADYSFAKDASFFFRYGEATEAVNPFKSNLAVGVYKKGLIVSRADDEAGVVISAATRSKYYKKALTAAGEKSEDTETSYELTYKYVCNDTLSIQPDLQYITNPGTNPELKDSWSGILRLKFSF